MRRALLILPLLLAGCGDSTLSNKEIVAQRDYCRSQHMEPQYIHNMWSDGPVNVICVDTREVWWNENLQRYEGNKQ